MATAASLAGVEDNGSAWRHRILIRLPKDIPELFKNCETKFDMIKLVHNIASVVVKDLNKVKHIDEDNIEEFVERLESSLICGDLIALETWSDNDLLDICENLEKELIYQLNAIYDWADYNRVLIVTN